MMKKNLITYFLIIMTITASVLIFIAMEIYKDEKKIRFEAISQELQIKAKTLIEQKKESTLMIALALSKDHMVKKALKNNDPSILSLDRISRDFNKVTSFKNVWLHMIRNDGISFTKSWTPKKGESILHIRKDIRKLLKEPKVFSVMSVGKYDMTIKAIVPIYEEKNFLGLFEVITKVNSIAKKFQKDSVEPVILADKSYKKQLTIPFSKKFVNEYYVANVDASDNLIEVLKKENIEDIITKNYTIVDNHLLSNYIQHNVNGENMGYFLIFKDLNSIDTSDILQKGINFVLVWITFAGVLLTILFMILHTSYTGLLERQVNLKTKELNEINDHLTQRVEEETKKNIEQEKELFQQRKIIDMNDLLNNIAHHWRQPLSIISTSASAIKLSIEYETDTKEDTSKKMDSIIESADLLSGTIDYFHSALKDEDRLIKFDLLSFSNKINTLVDGVLKANHISFDIEHEDENIHITTYETKLINVVLSLISNGKDVLVRRGVKNRHIIMATYKLEGFICIDVIDNAGGVEPDLIDKIFEPYFTTAHKSINKGLSLYLSHENVKEVLEGKLSVVNTDRGAKFTIKIPQRIMRKG